MSLHYGISIDTVTFLKLYFDKNPDVEDEVIEEHNDCNSDDFLLKCFNCQKLEHQGKDTLEDCDDCKIDTESEEYITRDNFREKRLCSDDYEGLEKRIKKEFSNILIVQKDDDLLFTIKIPVYVNDEPCKLDNLVVYRAKFTSLIDILGNKYIDSFEFLDISED